MHAPRVDARTRSVKLYCRQHRPDYWPMLRHLRYRSTRPLLVTRTLLIEPIIVFNKIDLLFGRRKHGLFVNETIYLPGGGYRVLMVSIFRMGWKRLARHQLFLPGDLALANQPAAH